MEKRDVATKYIPGAFMQADMDKEVVHLPLHGKWQTADATQSKATSEIYPDYTGQAHDICQDPKGSK